MPDPLSEYLASGKEIVKGYMASLTEHELDTSDYISSDPLTEAKQILKQMNSNISTGNALTPEDEQENIVGETKTDVVPQSENGTTNGILLKFDPTIELPEIKTFLNNPAPEEDPDYGVDSEMQQTKVTGILSPLIRIGSTVIPIGSVKYMKLTDTFFPKVTLRVEDKFDLVKTFDKPTRDNKLQIQIIPTFDNAYKKINLTFWIENLSFTDGYIDIIASYNIPNFYNNVLKAYGEISTYEFCEKVAKDLQLGFASNLDSTNDTRWIYIPNEKVYTALDRECFLGGGEEQILSWWVDYWNCLNLVDIYERNKTIDSDLKMWVYPKKIPDTETGEKVEPILMESFITNNDIYRDTQIYVGSYTDSLRMSKVTDKIVETYKINDMEEDNFVIQDGDVNNDIFTNYEYGGENFGDYPYIKQSYCRDMWIAKVNNSTIKLSLWQPCLGLMKGHKVNFYWYNVNEFTKVTEDSDDVNSNIPLPVDADRDKASGLDPKKVEDKMIIDKQVSGQYYITDSTFIYNYNGGSYTWEHVLTLTRPEEQKEYFDWDSINIENNE